jgi:hypothetical protein
MVLDRKRLDGACLMCSEALPLPADGGGVS